MKFFDWLDSLNLDLEIVRYNNQENRFCASLSKGEFKDYIGDGILQSLHGNGTTPERAIADFADIISGKIVVFDKIGTERITYKVPKFVSIV